VPDCIETVRCRRDEATQGAVIEWAYNGNCSCDRIVVSRDGVPIATVPGTQTSLQLPDCTPGEYCVQCVQVASDGTTTMGPRHCCRLDDCPPPGCADCIQSVDCVQEGARVTIRWVASQDCRCEEVEIWHRNPLGIMVLVGTVPGGTASSFETGCRRGEFCIRCKCEDGTFGPFHCCSPLQCRPKFRRGDVDGDGEINITDGVRVLNHLFLGTGEITCPDAADTNDQGELNITSGVFILNWLFLGGREPPPPGPRECGEDDTDDAMEECAYEACPDGS
jgi:hypothetical protein